MHTSVTFRHLPSSDALRNHVLDKVEKFKKYLLDPVDIHVVLSVEKIRQIAEITVSSKNYRTHAVEESQDMYTSIDKVVSKLERALRRHKERVKNHKIDHKSFDAISSTIPAVE